VAIARGGGVSRTSFAYELPLRDNVAPAGAPDAVIRTALEEAGASGLADLDTVLAPATRTARSLRGQWQARGAGSRAVRGHIGAGLVLLD